MATYLDRPCPRCKGYHRGRSVVRTRLAQAGLRLAFLLNETLK